MLTRYFGCAVCVFCEYRLGSWFFFSVHLIRYLMGGGSRAASAKSKSTSAKANASPSLAQLLQAFMPTQGECAAGKALNPASGMCRIACTLGQERNLKNNCVNVKTLKSKGKRPPTGFNVFTRELSKLENIDKSQLMTIASAVWKKMSDAKKNKYKAKAAKLKPPDVCPEGKEMNDATGMCRIACAKGKKRNVKGNCVKRPLTGFNVFTRELGVLENIDKSDFMKSASKLWALMLDEEKERYKAYAATGMSRENCPDNKKRNLMGNCVYTYRSCKEGTEKNPMTLMCQEKCPEGTKLNLMGNCVNTSRKAPKPRPEPKAPKVCPAGKEMNDATGRCRITCAEGKKRSLRGNCVNTSRKERKPVIPEIGRPSLRGHRPPETGNHEPGARAPATFSRQRPVYVNKGGSGCVLRPSVPCEHIPWNHNTVSKVFPTKEHALAEKEKYDKFVPIVDKDSKFTVELVYTCDIDPSKVDAKCGKEYGRKEPLYQLVYIDGGQDLLMAARTVKFDTLFARLEAIFKGLCTMHRRKVMHLDIKPDNMVYNSSTGKLALIDFGLVHSFTEYTQELNSVFATQLFRFPYPYYPGEFPLLGNIINQENPSQRNANTDQLNIIVDRLVKVLHTHHPLSSLLRSSVNELRRSINAKIYMREYETDVTTYIPDKVDVYGLGASIINILRMSVESKQTSIDSMEEFYVGVVMLCTKMVAASPRDRFSAHDAKKEYDRLKKDEHNRPQR